MQGDFSELVQRTLGPFFERNDFELDAVDENSGTDLVVVYLRSPTCKLQIYSSPRNGEVNCMIAAPDTPNASGAERHRGQRWHYISELSGRDAGASVEELLERRRASRDVGPRTTAQQLEDLRDLLESDFTAACAHLQE